MKKRLIKLASLMLSFFVAFSLIIIPATDDVNAGYLGKKVKYAKSITVNIGPYKPTSDNMMDFGFYIDMGKRTKNAKKVTVKSSNESIISTEYSGGDIPTFDALKAGKATLTIKVKKKSGKVYKYKTKVTVNKLGYPFTSFKLGKKDLTKKFKKGEYAKVKLRGTKSKLSIKLAKGWKVESIRLYRNYTTDGETKEDFTGKKFKNNSKISFKKSKKYDDSLMIWLKHKRTGVTQGYYIEIV